MSPARGGSSADDSNLKLIEYDALGERGEDAAGVTKLPACRWAHTRRMEEDIFTSLHLILLRQGLSLN